MKRLAVLLVPLLLVVAACSDDDDGTEEAAASSTTTTTSEATSTTAGPATTTTTGEEPAAAVVSDAGATVTAWIEAIAAGDDDAAIALTSPRSLEAVGGSEGFAEMEIELAEGWGSWASAESLETIEATLDDGTVVVTLHGEVAHEGPPEESWTSLPVVATADGDRVEPFLDLGKAELDPPTGAAIEPTQELAAFVFAGREVALLVDGVLVAAAVEGADGDQQRASVSHTFEPGVHGFAVAVTNESGVMVRNGVYTVVGG